MALAFGIIALVVAVFGVLIAGWVSVGIAVVLGALAIFFQIKKNKELEEGARRKKAGMVCAIIGIVLALIAQFGLMGVADKMKEAAEKDGNAPLLAAGSEGLKTLGVIGVYMKAKEVKPADMTDEQFLDALKEETDRVGKLMNN